MRKMGELISLDLSKISVIDYSCADERQRKGSIGNLKKYLKNTLNLLAKKGNITAKELSEIINLEANASGMRLLNLYKKDIKKI